MDKDVDVFVVPSGNWNPSNDFNAPHRGLELRAVNEIVYFKFIYTVAIQGSSVKVSGGIEKYITAEKDTALSNTRRGLALIEGELNTVHESISAVSYKM